MFELISANQKNRWQEILDFFNINDIYYSAEYLISSLKLDPGEALLFYYMDDKGEGDILYPFIKRKLKEESGIFYDITSPFGYGGPITKVIGDRYKLSSNFLDAFSKYCRSEKIIAEYIRFHPLLTDSEIFGSGMEIIPVCQTHTFDLDILTSERKMRNKNMDTSISDINTKKLGTVEHMFEFLVLYYSTIRQSEEIDNYYFFTNDYFESLVSALGSNLQLFGASKDNKLLTACYVLAKGETIYYHLNGNSEDINAAEVEKELLQSIALWGTANNFRFFHLTGKIDFAQVLEISNQNPKSFSSSTFYIGRVVHDQELYKNPHLLEEVELIKRYGNSSTDL